MQAITPQPGSARDARNFVGRRRTTETATRKLLSGSNLLLNDPRRMGKTYWLSYFAETTRDFDPVLIDYEGVRTREAFLLRTVEALRKNHRFGNRHLETLKAFFDNFDTTFGGGPVQVKVALQHQSPAKLLADALVAVNENSTKTVLICMDEVPLALLGIAGAEGPESAREVLHTLRLLRQNLGNVRWIVAGSVGFHHVLTACGTTEGDINDLESLKLGPLTSLEGEELAARLLLGIGRDADHSTVNRLVERTGAIPYLLHKVASMLDTGDESPVTSAQVDEAFEDFIDDPDEFRSFAHLLTRLEPNYGADADLARRILDQTLSRENSWISAGEVTPDPPGRFGAVLEKLVSDHYLERIGGQIRWRYPTLQYIWARRQRKWERP